MKFERHGGQTVTVDAKSCPGIHYRTPLLGMTQRHSNLEQLAAQFKQLGLVREPPSVARR